MKVSRTVLLSCSLVFAGPVLAQEFDFGGQLDDIRQQLIDECGDPDQADPVQEESILLCQQHTLENLADSQNLPWNIVLPLMNEIQMQQAFLDGLNEGESQCGSGGDDGEGDEGDPGYRGGADGNTVTVCLVPPRRSGRPVSIDVPPWAAEAIIGAGAYEGPCQRGMGGRKGPNDRASRLGGEKNDRGNGDSRGLGAKDNHRNKETKTTNQPGKKGGKSEATGKSASGKKTGKKTASSEGLRSGQRRR